MTEENDNPIPKEKREELQKAADIMTKEMPKKLGTRLQAHIEALTNIETAKNLGIKKPKEEAIRFYKDALKQATFITYYFQELDLSEIPMPIKTISISENMHNLFNWCIQTSTIIEAFERFVRAELPELNKTQLKIARLIIERSKEEGVLSAGISSDELIKELGIEPNTLYKEFIEGKPLPVLGFGNDKKMEVYCWAEESKAKRYVIEKKLEEYSMRE